ncbi:MAG: energy-coupled thiamine transporter ThiT [Bacteroides sp.]|nr:energy-coupled thiamine transporter ThiT [Bacteroides sp.]
MNNKTLRLTESAIMLALGFILSLLKIIDMPFGGSVTVFGMLPVIVIAYRYGTAWGLLTGFAASLLQMLTGLKNLTYGTSAGAVIAIILLDYAVAFTAMGLGGIFKGKIKDQGASLAAGAFAACLVRYICHTAVGCTVWAGVSIPTSDGIWYSMAYNAAYMIPETVITVVGAYFAGKIFTLSEQQIKPIPMSESGAKSAFAAVPAAIGTVVAFVFVFAMVQTEDGFDITAITQTDIFDWLAPVIVLAIGIAVSVIVKLYASKEKK